MFKHTQTYKGLDGTEYTGDFYFHLSESEIIKMELSGEGNSLHDYFVKISKENNGKKIIEMFEEILHLAYGEKDPGDLRFVKSKELSKAFSETDAYNKLFVRLVTDAEFSAVFMNNLAPADLGQNHSAIPPQSNLSPENARARSEASLQGFQSRKETRQDIEKTFVQQSEPEASFPPAPQPEHEAFVPVAQQPEYTTPISLPPEVLASMSPEEQKRLHDYNQHFQGPAPQPHIGNYNAQA